MGWSITGAWFRNTKLPSKQKTLKTPAPGASRASDFIEEQTNLAANLSRTLKAPEYEDAAVELRIGVCLPYWTDLAASLSILTWRRSVRRAKRNKRLCFGGALATADKGGHADDRSDQYD